MFFAMCVIKTKKREGPLSVTRPAFRGSGMPFTIERATQKPHADMYITNHYTNSCQ